MKHLFADGNVTVAATMTMTTRIVPVTCGATMTGGTFGSTSVLTQVDVLAHIAGHTHTSYIDRMGFRNVDWLQPLFSAIRGEPTDVGPWPKTEERIARWEVTGD